MDISAVLGIITKGGPAALVLALFYGLATLVREVRVGKASADKEADLLKRVATLETEMLAMKAELMVSVAGGHVLIYQRDQARVRVEYLEQKHNEDPRTIWPPDPPRGNV